MPEETFSAEVIQKIADSLSQLRDPETGRTLAALSRAPEVFEKEGAVHAKVPLSRFGNPIAEDFVDQAISRIHAVTPGAETHVETVTFDRIVPRIGQIGLKASSVILVGSGKGGVGKSTVAASIALTLHSMGCRVGLMDADVYGPSIPQLLGVEGRPAISENKRIEPIMRDGMPLMSMGFLLEKDQAVVWRGPMLHGSINQFLGETEWGELDYLIIDMPPGTGDVALTLSQAVPISGAVVVCTPQEVALLDAVKAVSMFNKVKVPILGIVENMSGFQCPDTGKTYDIFGKGGAREKADELKVGFLGELPIDVTLRVAGDDGKLAETLASQPASRAPFEGIVKAMVRRLASQMSQTSSKPSLPTL